MNRTIAIIILAGCTASVARCGAAEVHLVGYSEPEWKEWNEEYIRLAGYTEDYRLMSITYFDDPAYLGQCVKRANGRAWVLINQSWYQKLGRCGQKALLWHELGHCLSGLKDLPGHYELMSGQPVIDNSHWCRVLTSMGVPLPRENQW